MKWPVDPTHGSGIEASHMLSQHLDVNGDGTGAHNINGVYTLGITDGVFFCAPPAGSVYYVTDFHIHVEDTALRPDFYTSAAALTNGMLLHVMRGATAIYNGSAGEAVKKTAQWSHVLHDVTYHNTGAGNAFMSGHHSFLGSQGRALVLDGDQGDLIRIVGQDDLSGLVDHEFIVQGIIASKRTRT